MSTEQYTGFYPSKPFWAGSSIDFDDPESMEKFTDLMSEEIFTISEGSCTIKIYRDGMILIRISELEISERKIEQGYVEKLVSRWGQYLDYLNCLYLIIDAATMNIQKLSYFNLSEITHRDAFRVTFEDGKWKGESIASESIASVYQMARYESSYRPGIPMKLDSRISSRHVISMDVLKESARLFIKIKDNQVTIKMLSNVAKSLSEYKIGNYDTSLILSWFVIESVITKKWSDYLMSKNITYESAKKRINLDRMSFFKGRDFTVSHMCNLLEISDILEFNIFEEIDQIRRCRNKIIHQIPGFEPSEADCLLAIKKAIELALESYDINLEPNLGYSVAGL